MNQHRYIRIPTHLPSIVRLYKCMLACIDTKTQTLTLANTHQHKTTNDIQITHATDNTQHTPSTHSHRTTHTRLSIA